MATLTKKDYKEFISLVAKMREAQKKTDDLYCDDEWWHKRAKQLESEIDEYLKKMKEMRKSIPRKVRQEVYERYNGHCAYCGCELDIKDMQVDHLDSVYRAEYEGRETDNTTSNYMPSCRQCNIYKGTATIEEFRGKIQHLKKTALIVFPVRLAQKYDIIQVNEWDGKFYFEKEE